MVGSPLIAGVIAQLAFWVLLVIGIFKSVLTKFGAAVFLLLWLVGYVGLPRITGWTGALVTSWVAVLDIVLVFVVFKGDVRLT